MGPGIECMLNWLWDSAARLGSQEARLFWILTGPTSSLPHAVTGLHVLVSGEAVIVRVMPYSYTVKFLIYGGF